MMVVAVVDYDAVADVAEESIWQKASLDQQDDSWVDKEQQHSFQLQVSGQFHEFLQEKE